LDEEDTTIEDVEVGIARAWRREPSWRKDPAITTPSLTGLVNSCHLMEDLDSQPFLDTVWKVVHHLATLSAGYQKANLFRRGVAIR
jgi:hypothetical protein